MNNSDKSDKTKNKTKKKTKNKSKNKKKNKSPANPPKSKKSKKSGSLDINSNSNDNKPSNHTSYISDKREDLDSNYVRQRSERIRILDDKPKYIKDIKNHGYLLDIMNYDDAIKVLEDKKKTKRRFCSTLLSAIRWNSMLIFALPIDPNDLFIKVSVIILSLSLFIFLNIACMYDSYMLHLYTGGGEDRVPYKAIKPRYKITNILVPFLSLYLPTMLLKKYISIREFIFDQIKKYFDITKSNKNKAQKQLGLHDIETQISKFKNKIEGNSSKVFFFGGIFLLFNLYMTTCFCGIYENSNLCLILNTFLSIIWTYLITYGILLGSTILRRCGLLFKIKMMFNLSRIFNPTILLYSEEARTLLITIILISFFIISLFIIFI